jgi:site-specific DNA-methyltransferase (adenine-specific)
LSNKSNEEYCCWAEKRLLLSDNDNNIQGYSNGVFWEKNTLNLQTKESKKLVKRKTDRQTIEMFAGVL